MKVKHVTSKLMAILLVVLLEIVMETRGAPVSTDAAALIKCPTPSGLCWSQPEDTCTDDSECSSFLDTWIGLCCPHVCEGKKTCRDFRLPTPPTTTRPTTEDVTTTRYTTEESTPYSTSELATSTPRVTQAATTTESQFTTTTSSTNEPPTDEGSTSTEEYSTTKEPRVTELKMTPRAATETMKSTIKLTTQEITTTKRTTSKAPTTTKKTTTTEAPTTTSLPTTSWAPSTTPLPTTRRRTTQEPTPDPSICGQSEARDIFFILDGTANYRQYWVTRAREFKQIKQFLKDVISELNRDSFRIGLLQYGGRKEPRMEIDFWEGIDTKELKYQVDDIRQMGGRERSTGEALAVAGNKLYELNSLYERASAQDIVVLLTRGRPSDDTQTFAEAEMLKRRMVRVITIGLTPYPRSLARYLRDIPTSAEDALYSKYNELEGKQTKVLEKMCLPIHLPGTESLCRNKKYDIHFVVDGSRSIGWAEFDKKRRFLRDVFFLLESPSSDMNTGMMQFSVIDKTEEVLQLEKHSLDEEVYVVENMEYHFGRRTMLGDALSRVNDKVFNGRGGDRSAVENILVIFSDGRAHDIVQAYTEADKLKSKNVRVMAVSVDENSRVSEQMKRLASDPKYTMKARLSNTAYFAKKVVSMICQTEE